MIRVGLLWHSLDSGNLGLRALTLSQLHLLDRAAVAVGRDIQVVLFGQPPWEGLPPTSFAGERVTVAGRCDLGRSHLTIRMGHLARALRECDLLIDVGEGDGFTSLYGTRRLLKQIAAKELALRSGRPLILAPQTIGPFDSRTSRLLAAAFLRRAAQIFTRDTLSLECVHDLAGRRDAVELADLAFCLPWAPRPRGSGSLRVGINPSGLLYRNARAFGVALDYPRLMDRMIEAFSARSGIRLILVPHVCGRISAADQDLACCRALAERHSGIEMAMPSDDPRETKALIGALDFFVGTRLHACIAAFSSGVPLLPMAYSRKTTGLFHSLGYPGVADLTANSIDTVLQLALRALDDREALRRQAEVGNREADRRLAIYSRYLETMLAACG